MHVSILCLTLQLKCMMRLVSSWHDTTMAQFQSSSRRAASSRSRSWHTKTLPNTHIRKLLGNGDKADLGHEPVIKTNSCKYVHAKVQVAS